MTLIFKKSTAQPEFTVGAAITGTVQVGETLTCTYTVTKARASNVTVRWYRHANAGAAGVEIGTGTTYVLTGNDFEFVIRAIVTAVNPAGAATSTSDYTSEVAVAAPPDPPTIVSEAAISGTVEVGQSLTVTYDFDGESSVAIQWYSYLSAAKAGAVALGTSSVQGLGLSEDGRWIGCEVSATNGAGTTKSTAVLVGPVAANASAAPSIIASATISLDDGADDYNEGEYIICDAEFSGHTSTPTFTWYKCDAGKTNPVELVGAGVAAIQPLPVSEPNAYRGALFLDQSLALNADGKYVYCVATGTNGAGSTPSESDAVGPIGAIQGTAISQATVGDGPYVINSAGTYYLAENISTKGTGIQVRSHNVTINLNGRTLTFDNDTLPTITNQSFETGDGTGWDFTNAGGSAGTPNTTYCQIITAPTSDNQTAEQFGFNNYLTSDGVCSLRWNYGATQDDAVSRWVESGALTCEANTWYSVSANIWATGTNRQAVRLWLAVYDDLGNQAVRFTTPTNIAYTQGHRWAECIFKAAEGRTYHVRLGVTGAATATAYGYFDNLVIGRPRACGIVAGTSSARPAYGGNDFDYINETSYTPYFDDAIKIVYACMAPDILFNGTSYESTNVVIKNGSVVQGNESPVAMGVIARNLAYQVTGTAATNTLTATSAMTTRFANNTRVLFYNGPDGVGLSNERLYWVRDFDLGSRSFKLSETQGGAAISLGADIAGARVAQFAGLHRTNVTVRGPNSFCVRTFGVSTTNATYRMTDNAFSSLHNVCAARDMWDGAAVANCRGVIARNTITGCVTAGLLMETSANSPVYGNTVRTNVKYTNGFAVILRAQSGGQFYDNIIDNTGAYYGRGLSFLSSTGGDVFNNRISVQLGRWGAEYNGWPINTGEANNYGDYALQCEYASAGNTLRIYGNEIYYLADGFDLAGKYPTGVALKVSGNKAGSDVRVYNNTITADGGAGGTGASYCVAMEGLGPAIQFYENTLRTNSGFMRFSGTLPQLDRCTFELVSPDSLKPWRFAAAGSSSLVKITDPVYGTGAGEVVEAARPVRTTDGTTAGTIATTSSIAIEYTITFNTTLPNATVTISGGTGTGATSVSGTADASGVFVYPVRASTAGTAVVSHGTYTVTADDGVSTTTAAFTADATKTVELS